MTTPDITQKEKRAATNVWRGRLAVLQRHNLIKPKVFKDVVKFVEQITQAENIGHSPCQIRPGNIGKLDMFIQMRLAEFSLRDRMIVAGLDPSKIMADKARKAMASKHNIGIDNFQEIAQTALFDTLTPEECTRFEETFHVMYEEAT